MNAAGLTQTDQIGGCEGFVGIFIKGAWRDRIQYNKSAIMMAFVHVENAESCLAHV